MTNETIPNVQRKLLEELRDAANDGMNATTRQHQIDHFAGLIAKVDALLSAPSPANHVEDVRAMVDAQSPAGVDGLDVVAWVTTGFSGKSRTRRAFTVNADDAARQHTNWTPHYRQVTTDQLCRLSDAQAIIDGLRAENETLRKRAKTAEREAESALKTYKGLEKLARVVSDNSDQVCGELNVTRQQRDQLAGLLRMIASRGLSPVLTEHELEQIDASLAGLEAPGPAPAVKLCVACRTLHPLDHFDKAAHDFPTRDGLNCNCRKSVAERGYHLMRLPNGKVEPRP